MVWGQQPQRIAPKSRLGEPSEEAVDAMNNNDNGGYYDNDDGGDNDYQEQGNYNVGEGIADAYISSNNSSVGAPLGFSGLAIDTNKLVQATRIVEKLLIKKIYINLQ